MHQPSEIKVLPNYHLYLKFPDGVEGSVDLSYLKGKGVFKLWEKAQAFEQVHLGEHGELVWNKDVELCSDSLYFKLANISPKEAFA